MEEENINKKILFNAPIRKFYRFSFAFKQQLLQAWRPKPTLKCALFCYSVIGALFLAIGISLLVKSNVLYESTIRYDNLCPEINKSCQAFFEISDSILSAPIYFMYSITNFYQNHRLYVKSVSLNQLRDQTWYTPSQLTDCSPIITNADNIYQTNVNGEPLDLQDSAFPCGLIAKTYFNDTFRIFNNLNNQEVVISDKGIAWPDDLQYNFKNFDLSRQWMDITNERFINWMKISPFTSFRKTWGVINTNLEKGIYRIEIQNNWNSTIFNGEKSIILTQTNLLGGQNLFLGYCYISVGILSFIFILIFVFRKLQRPKGVLEEKIKEIENYS